MALGIDLEHCEAVFLIEERDALDQPGKTFGVLGWWLILQPEDSAKRRGAWQAGRCF